MGGERISGVSFWAHVRRCVGKVSFVFDAVALYFCMVDDATPASVKAVIAVALVYFVTPSDAIPDWTPIYGWVDDGAVIAGTLALVRDYVTEEHRHRARAVFAGDAEECPHG